MYPINVTEKKTGVSKYLLRMWERRYTFPKPLRDSKGERIYTDDDVTKLILVKELMGNGYRPSKIINRPIEELLKLKEADDQKAGQLKAYKILIIKDLNLVDDLHKLLEKHEHHEVYHVATIEELQKILD